jgi:hypothetical protein
MNQKLSEWASIAEIVSGAAVVVTLVFLVLSIRENSAITRASMFSNSIDSLIENRRDRLLDDALYDSFRALNSGDIDGLDDREIGRLVLYHQNLFQIYEKAYFTREYDLLGDAEWSRFERVICGGNRVLSDAGLVDTAFNSLTDAFREYISDTCD